ncbi:MAG: glycoside hydrolase family 1 protein [Micrococcales bacterium]
MAKQFPKDFVWGVAAAGHQIEGFNTQSDLWFCEQQEPSVFREKSGIACDSYNRWAEDLDITKAMNVNTYRMSIEWARIQPTEDSFDDAEFAHYEAILDGCIARGLKTNVTMNHFASPHWFAMQAGWLNPKAPELFAKYCEEVVRRLGSKIDYIVTFNEPNLPKLLSYMDLPPIVQQLNKLTMEGAARNAGVEKYRTSNVMLDEDYDAYGIGMERGHELARKAMKAIVPNTPIGLSIAMIDDQLENENTNPTARDAKREDCYGQWLRLARHDEFMGVQNYERMFYNDNGRIDPKPGAKLNSFGNELHGEALANCVEYAHSITGKPIMVTEHGVNAEDDTEREWIITESLKGLLASIERGTPVWGYTHWSLLDNFEWVFGYGPKFGLCSVDRETMARTRKPSSYVYAGIAAANAI